MRWGIRSLVPAIGLKNDFFPRPILGSLAGALQITLKKTDEQEKQTEVY